MFFGRERLWLAIFFFMFLCVGPSFGQSTDMAHLQRELVRVASVIRLSEDKLNHIEGRLAELRSHADKLEKDYTQQRAKMAGTLQALTQMGRMPRAAMLVRPGGPLQAARTSMLLSAAVPGIEVQANALKTLLEDLQKTKNDLSAKAEQATQLRNTLKSRHTALSALMDRRAQNPQAIIWRDDIRKINALGAQAKNLSVLLNQLDNTGTTKGDAQALGFDSLPDDEGVIPVSGIVRVGYGVRGADGKKAQGLRIEALSGSLVVAPLAGIVRYAGPFRGYGNIIIVAHKGGYYSLLAGVQKISVEVGQAIVSGEPIAILGDDRGVDSYKPAERKQLYYELRRAGVPVNPSRKLPGLG